MRFDWPAVKEKDTLCGPQSPSAARGREEESMRRRLPFAALTALLALALAACGGAGEETPTPMPEPVFTSLVSVTGELVPAEWADVSVETSGTVLELPVEPGDTVSAGDLLVKLDPVDAELTVHETEAQLARAKADVDRLLAQPRAIDVAAAEQNVEEAETGIEQAEAERERRAVVIASQGELEASKRLQEAAENLSQSPGAMHLRTLQTIRAIAADPSEKIVLFVPADLGQALARVERVKNE